ncbi:MAG: chemotaxis protein CheA [Candidatus Hydrogenedentes bacterium]|nr:chemotaxis protein CheA [Candidatus Hydrogenedentota bacterium]
MEKVLERLESLAEALVLMETSDLPALANLHSELQELLTWSQQEGLKRAPGALTTSANLVEGIILGDVADPSAAMDFVSKSVSAVQEFIRDGRAEEEIDFPELTGQASAQKGADQSEATDDRADQRLVALEDAVPEIESLLTDADVRLVALDNSLSDAACLRATYRLLHTATGTAGFLEMRSIEALAKACVSLLERAIGEGLTLTSGHVDLMLKAVSCMKHTLQHTADMGVADGEHVEEEHASELVERLREATEGPWKDPGETIEVTSSVLLGDILVESGIADRQAVEQALANQRVHPDDVETCKVLVRAGVLTWPQLTQAISVQSQSRDGRSIDVVLIDLGMATREAIDSALKETQNAERTPLGEIMIRKGAAAAEDVAAALRTQRQIRQGVVELKEAVKVDADRLDRLIDLIGELVIAESMVCQAPEILESAAPAMIRQINRLDKITRELQEIGTSLRMVPVKSTFQKMARLVRDLARKADKQIEFRMSGDDTELDKTVVDKIGDPLVHIVRNAVDHGIESSKEERVAAGKHAVARIELRAYHKGGSIHIEVQDDGKGLDKERILAKARERGIVSDSDVLSDEETWALIFEPGFSTATTVTDVSGRGVGMDVVRRNIESLRGQVDIQSERGKGATFTIRLPLTLAIIDGMVVRVGAERYIIPTLSVVRSIRPQSGDLLTVVQRGVMLKIQGELIPVFALSELFNVSAGSKAEDSNLIVIIEDEGKRIGLVVDDLLGKQQTVIKSLGETMRGLPGIAGAAIMSDGNVGLILDVASLIRMGTSAVSSENLEHDAEFAKPN